MMHIIFVAAMGGDGAATQLPRWLSAWVEQCAHVAGSTEEWRTGIPVFDRAGVQTGVLEMLHRDLYRWPDCVRREEEYLGRGPDESPAERDGVALQFDRAVIVTPAATQVTLAVGEGRGPELGVQLDSRFVMKREVPEAPWLLGRWMSDHPTEYTIDTSVEDRATVDAPVLRLRAIFGKDGDSALAHRIDVLQNDEVVNRFEYDDFREVTGYPGRVGFVRVFSGLDAPGTLVQVNTDRLVAAQVRSSTPDSEFQPERTSLAERFPGLLVQLSQSADRLPLEPASNGGEVDGFAPVPGSVWPVGWSWVALAAGVGVASGLVYAWRRRGRVSG